MKLARLSALALAAALVLPAVSSAQEVLNFNGVKTSGGSTIHGAQTGAYLASRSPFTTNFDIYCIDYDHDALTPSWTAHAITFQQAVGTYSAEANLQLGTTPTWGIAELRAAAYLSTQFAVTPQAQWDQIHGSIWSLFSSNTDLVGHTSLAASAVANQGGNAYWDSYVVLLDQNAFNPNFTGKLNQVFITNDPNTMTTVVTPEPSTWALMGVGLFAVGFARRRRRVA